MRKTLGILLVVVTAIALVGWSTPTAAYEVEEWVFHAISPRTGGFASFGIECEWAMRVAADDVNAAGGINGKPLRVVYHDSAGDAAKASVEASKAVDDKALMTSVMTAGPEANGALEVFFKNEVLSIAPCVGSNVNLEYAPWTVGFLNFDETMWGPAAVAWLEMETDITSIVPIYDSSVAPYVLESRSYQWWMREKMGKKILKEVTFEQFSTVDYGPLAVAVLKQKPDGAQFTCIGEGAALIIKELNKRGFTEGRRIMLHAGADYPEYYDIGKGYVENTYLETLYWTEYPGEVWQRIVKKWNDEHEKPMGFGVWSGYEVPWMFKRAIEATGVTGDPAKVVEERVMLADWCYNRPAYQFMQGKFPISNGLSTQDIHLNQIRDNKKFHLKAISAITDVPSNWNKPNLYRDHIYDEEGNRIKVEKGSPLPSWYIYDEANGHRVKAP
jgi:branched-chain amino acid transport system substrate-binding protein